MAGYVSSEWLVLFLTPSLHPARHFTLGAARFLGRLQPQAKFKVHQQDPIY